MNFISIGIKEVNRRLRRQKNRLALHSAREALEEAETAFGRFGWRYLTDQEGLPEPLKSLRKHAEDIKQTAARIAEIEANIKSEEVEKDRVRHTYQSKNEEIDQTKRPLLKTERSLRAQIEEQQTMLHKKNWQGQEAFSEKSELVKKGEELEVELKNTREAIALLDTQLTNAQVEFVEKDKEISLTISALTREVATCRRRSRHLEEYKHKGYRLAGQILANRSDSPPGSEEFYESVQLQAQVVLAMSELESDSVRQSREVNRQALRTFYFVTFTVAFILALAFLLIFRTPSKRDYLPANTEAVISLNLDQLQISDITQNLDPSIQPDIWRNLWHELIQKIKQVPELNPKSVVRITRAVTHLTTGATAEPTDYLIAELKSATITDSLIHRFVLKGSPFRYEYINGLAIYEKSPQLAVARIGPTTITVNDTSAVKEMVRVRLGLSPDLNVDNDFLNHFQRLGAESALRLITSQPSRLTDVEHPLFDPKLLEKCEVLGLAIKVTSQQPLSIFVLLQTANSENAKQVMNRLQTDSEKVLGIQESVNAKRVSDSNPPNNKSSFIGLPDVKLHRERGVEWRFQLTPVAARQFLLRISQLGLAGDASVKSELEPQTEEADKSVAVP